MMKVSYSTPNVCIYLELAILLILRETDKRQMPLLHHIVTFDNQEALR